MRQFDRSMMLESPSPWACSLPEVQHFPVHIFLPCFLFMLSFHFNQLETQLQTNLVSGVSEVRFFFFPKNNFYDTKYLTVIMQDEAIKRSKIAPNVPPGGCRFFPHDRFASYAIIFLNRKTSTSILSGYTQGAERADADRVNRLWRVVFRMG